MRAARIAVVSIASLVLFANDARARLIDDFTEGPIHLVYTNAEIEQSQTGLNPAAVISGQRKISIGAFGGGTVGQSATVDTDAGTLTFSSGSAGLGYFELEYGTQAMPLNADLTADGATHLAMIFQNVGATVNAESPPFASVNDGGAGGRIGFESSIPLSDGKFLARASFAANDHVNWMDVQTIYFSRVRYPRDWSSVIYQIATVPEPSALALAISSLCVAGVFRRRGISSVSK